MVYGVCYQPVSLRTTRYYLIGWLSLIEKGLTDFIKSLSEKQCCNNHLAWIINNSIVSSILLR